MRGTEAHCPSLRNAAQERDRTQCLPSLIAETITAGPHRTSHVRELQDDTRGPAKPLWDNRIISPKNGFAGPRVFEACFPGTFRGAACPEQASSGLQVFDHEVVGDEGTSTMGLAAPELQGNIPGLGCSWGVSKTSTRDAA